MQKKRKRNTRDTENKITEIGCIRRKITYYLAAVSLSVCLAGCSDGGGTAAKAMAADEELVVYCPHPLDLINPIVSEFELSTGIPVYVKTGGTGELLEMVEEGREPACDVFWGGSLSTTVPKKELFEPYISKNEDNIRDDYKNEEGNMTRFTDIPSVLMVNTNLIGEIPLEGYADLLRPELKGRIAMCDPARSSSAYEHLINMLYAMGKGDPEEGWEYVQAFCENLDGKLLRGSFEVYKGVADGRFAVGLTFEEGGAHYVADGSPVELRYMKEGVISTPDVVCIVKGTKHLKDAEDFVDFVTGKDAQTIIADRLDRRSVRGDVAEPDYLPERSEIRLIGCDASVVNDKKMEWLQKFDDLYQSTLH